jgi:hypothetical protein
VADPQASSRVARAWLWFHEVWMPAKYCSASAAHAASGPVHAASEPIRAMATPAPATARAACRAPSGRVRCGPPHPLYTLRQAAASRAMWHWIGSRQRGDQPPPGIAQGPHATRAAGHAGAHEAGIAPLAAKANPAKNMNSALRAPRHAGSA